jgi:RNA polymerase sigma-70 factor (ECF subfamily)
MTSAVEKNLLDASKPIETQNFKRRNMQRLRDHKYCANKEPNKMSQTPEDPVTTPHSKLVLRAQAGDEKAFTALFNYYRPGLGRYLLGLVRNIEDRDDLAQEAFIKAWRELPRLRDASLFKPWLYTIATNLVRDRKRRKWFEIIPIEDGDTREAPMRFEDAVAERELVKQALEQVRWKRRICLLLEIEGRLTLEEIAQVMGIDKRSVCTYISSARREFRQAYHEIEQRQHTLRERKSV